jgi:hypothetical protein
MDAHEAAFKIVFFLAVAVFCVAIVGVFLLIIKITFLFTPDFTILGIKFMPASTAALYQ